MDRVLILIVKKVKAIGTTLIKTAKKEAGSFGRSLKEIEDAGKSFSELLGAGMDTSGLERARTLVDDIRRGGRTEAQKQSHSDLKYPAKPFGELQKEIQNRLSNSNLKRDYSSMNATDLLKEIKSNEKAYSNIKRAIESKIASNGNVFNRAPNHSRLYHLASKRAEEKAN